LAPSRLQLSAIRTCEAVFQPRNVQDAFLASDSHVKTLIEAVKDGGVEAFDPLMVWWSGQGWYIIDGHHRLDAIRQAQKARSKLGITDVPVEVFAGTLNDAIAQSVASNSKNKLPMRLADKLEGAWRLIGLDNGMTKKQLHSVTAVSLRTIANMREKRKELIKQGEDPQALTWEDAKASQRPEINDDWEEQLARKWVEQLVRTFGDKFAKQPMIAARALELYSETLPHDLIRCWPEEAQAYEDELESAEF
jgi:ParB-like chromosome segregation protein Spo0J